MVKEKTATKLWFGYIGFDALLNIVTMINLKIYQKY